MLRYPSGFALERPEDRDDKATGLVVTRGVLIEKRPHGFEKAQRIL